MTSANEWIGFAAMDRGSSINKKKNGSKYRTPGLESTNSNDVHGTRAGDYQMRFGKLKKEMAASQQNTLARCRYVRLTVVDKSRRSALQWGERSLALLMANEHLFLASTSRC